MSYINDIKIEYHRELHSTNDHAKSQIKNNVLPFAVVAEKQTSGRGRRGKNWQSPAGGLYLSLVAPVDNNAPDFMQMTPLRVAVLIHQYLDKHLNTRTNIKWPNDLFYEGRKLCGILCEAQASSSLPKEIVIGIGFNLKKTAIDSTEYEAHFLEDIVNKNIDKKTLAEGLCRHIINHLNMANEQVTTYILQESTTYFWRSTDGEIFKMSDLDRLGQLILEKQDEAFLLSSVNHDYKWIHCDKNLNLDIQLIDIGNSNTKIYRSSTGRCTGDLRLLQSIPSRSPDLLSKHLQSIPTYIMSVDSQVEKSVSKLLERMNIQYVIIKKRSKRVYDFDVDGIGIDRLALMEGCLLDCPPKIELFICISFGTATTLDFVKKNGQHLGGYILPSRHLMALSLHTHTSALPMIDINATTQASTMPGKTTVDCISNGIEAFQKTFLNQVIKQASQTYCISEEHIKIYSTGSGYCSNVFLHDDLLLAKGMLSMIIG